MTSEDRRDEADSGRLIAAVMAGDEQAFRVLYRQHTPQLFRLALYLTAGSEADSRDLVQEMWLRAVRGLPRFRGDSSFATWLRAIMARCASELRRKEDRAPPEMPSGSGEPVIDAAAATRIDLGRAFEMMPSGYRSVLVLHDFEGLPHREIAESMGISEGTSKSQLFRARAWLRSALGDDYART